MTNHIDAETLATGASRRVFLQGAAGASLAAALDIGVVKAQAEVTLPKATIAITPFRVAVPQADIVDLKSRLARTRFPEKETVADWSQGVPLAKARALTEYWRDHYDWRKIERRLNAVP